MICRNTDELIRITVTSRSDLESQVEGAVESLLRDHQRIKDRGILVTRHSPWEFTVELHPGVPFGVTQEKDEWYRTPPTERLSRIRSVEPSSSPEARLRSDALLILRAGDHGTKSG